MKKWFFVVLIILLVPLSYHMAHAYEYSDISENHVNKNAIRFLTANGAIGGYSNGEFRPDAIINRVELLKVALQSKLREETLKDSGYYKYNDTEQRAWYATYLSYASANKIVSGYPDGTFRPAQGVNLVEALKMMIDLYDVPTPVYIQAPENWYDPYMIAAETYNLLENTKAKEPSELLTRKDTAQILYNIKTNKDLSGVGSKKITPVTVPYKGCNWKEFWSEEHKVGFLYENCFDRKDVEFSFENNKLYPSETIAGEKRSIGEIYYLEPGESPEEAIHRHVLQYYPEDQKNNCVAVPLEEPELPSTYNYYADGVRRYTIFPTYQYLEELDKDDNNLPWGMRAVCGPKGAVNARTYFEYHEGKDQLLYLAIGQDPGWLDEGSILFE